MVHAVLASKSSRASILALLVTCLGGFSASCLEANATLPGADGGGQDGGTTPKNDSSVPGSGTGSGSGTSPGVDATMPGTDSGGGGDAGATVPVCLNPSASNTACFTCVDTKCASTVGPAVTACAAFYSCFVKCDCSDQTCITACEADAPMSCDTPFQNLYTCQTTTCAAACPVDAGTPPVDSGTPLADAGATCKNPTATQTACAKCEQTNCPSVVTAEESACAGAFDTCFAQCDCSNTTCIDSCAESAPSGCQTALENLSSCQTGTACKATCAGTATDAGGDKDGGSSSGAIPDCANPTTAEKNLYTACSACDESKCSTEVAAAVSDCAAYYTCFAACDCSDTACQETCATDSSSNTACEAIINLFDGTLTECQDENCAADCE